MSVTVLCYAGCSTCQKALRWLDSQGVTYTLRPIKENPPTVQELALWQQTSGLPLKRFFNTSGQLYRSLGLKDKLPSMPVQEQLALLASDGMLVKRPLLVVGDRGLPGFQAQAWQALLAGEKV